MAINTFEVYRQYNGTGTTISLECETLHVMDDKQRIALAETKTLESSLLRNLGRLFTGPETVIRYQFGSHLGSASVELDERGGFISYEEYHPYGMTSYHAMTSAAEGSLKRYRFTGKERDEETGFSYHVARYYAPWLGRWVNADPAGLVDGTCEYAYVTGRPTELIDPGGINGKKTEKIDVEVPNAQILDESAVKFASQVTVKTTTSAGVTITLRADKIVQVQGQYYYVEEKLAEKALTIEGDVKERAFTENQLKKGGLKAVFEGKEIEIRGGTNLQNIGLNVGDRVTAGLHVITENELRAVKNLATLVKMAKEERSSSAPTPAQAATPNPQAKSPTPVKPVEPPSPASSPVGGRATVTADATSTSAKGSGSPTTGGRTTGTSEALRGAAGTVLEKGTLVTSVGQANTHEEAARELAKWYLAGLVLSALSPAARAYLIFVGGASIIFPSAAEARSQERATLERVDPTLATPLQLKAMP